MHVHNASAAVRSVPTTLTWLLAAARLDGEVHGARHLERVAELEVGTRSTRLVHQAAARSAISGRHAAAARCHGARACHQLARGRRLACSTSSGRRARGLAARRALVALGARVAASGGSCSRRWRVRQLQLRNDGAKAEDLVAQPKAAGHGLEGVQVAEHHVLLKDGAHVGRVDACQSCANAV